MELLSFIALITVFCCTQNTLLQAQLTNFSPLIIEGGSCTAFDKSNITGNIRLAIRDQVSSILDDRYGPTNGCGGEGWTKIADLDFSDPNQTCPSNQWRYIYNNGAVRGCGNGAPNSCQSAFFSSGGVSYTQVCGQINAIQFGTSDAFRAGIEGRTIEQNYVDGISLTYGSPGSRKHIWTFAAVIAETRLDRLSTCACSNRDVPWNYNLPSFIGNNYFCASANRGPEIAGEIYYPSDPLWDGKGCGPTSDCCELNNSPWFLSTLPNPTSDNIEARICNNEPLENEDTVITKVLLYVK